MRTITTFLFSLATICIWAGNPLPYAIEGKVGPESDSLMIYLVYQDVNLNMIEDSCRIADGAYSFKGETESPFYAQMYISREGDKNQIANEDIYVFYIEPGEITIESADYLWNSVVFGSPIMDLKYEFDDYIIPYQEKADVLNRRFQEAGPEKQNDPIFIDSLNSDFEVISNEFYNAAMKFIADHPESMLSVFMLQDHLSGQPNDENVEVVFDALSDKVKNTPAGRRLESVIRMYKTLPVGVEAPDFTVNDTNGQPVSLSKLRGKYVFLVFWSPTCSHCLSEVPNLKQAYQLYKDKGFEIISVGLENEEGKQYWQNVIQDNNMNWINVSDFKEYDSEIFQSYKAYSVPKNYLIGPDGTIVGKELYGNKLLQKLVEIFR